MSELASDPAAAVVSRRRFVHILGLGAAATLVAACQPATPPAPTATTAPPKPAAQPTAAPAAAATAAPAAAKPTEAPKPAAAASPAAAPAAKPTTAPAAAPAAAASPAAAPAAKPGADWNALVEAARREGKLVLKGPNSPEVRTILVRAFKERFGVDIDYTGASSSQALAQLRTERAAGLYSTDVYFGGATTLYTGFYGEKLIDPLKPALIHPDALDLTKWPRGRLPFDDPEDQYILRLSLLQPLLISVNTDLVKPAEITSWQDLLKPQFRGKISADDPLATGAGSNMAIYLYTLFGEDYIRKLYLDQKVVYSREARQLADWAARGTHPISLALGESDLKAVIDEGFPVAAIPNPPAEKAYVTSSPGHLTLMNRAPNPNAAKLMVNWLATKDGMEVFSRVTDLPPIRLDADKSHWDAAEIPTPGGNYIDFSNWEWVHTTQAANRDKVHAILKG